MQSYILFSPTLSLSLIIMIRLILVYTLGNVVINKNTSILISFWDMIRSVV